MTRNLSRWQQHLCGHSLGAETSKDLILLWRQSVNLGSVFMFFFPPPAKPLSCGNSCSSKISKNKQEVNSFLFQNFTLKDENSAHVDEVEDRCHEVMDIGTNCLCRLLSNSLFVPQRVNKNRLLKAMRSKIWTYRCKRCLKSKWYEHWTNRYLCL